MGYATEPVWARVDVADDLSCAVTYGTEDEVRAAEGHADPGQGALVTNTYSDRASLEVRKVVSSTREADKEARYPFRVTLYEDESHGGVLALTGTFGDMEFADGVATFELGDGESAKADGLPLGEGGLAYEVEETDSKGLASSLRKAASEEFAGDVVTCTNTYAPGGGGDTPTSKPSTSTKAATTRTATARTGDPTGWAAAAGLLLAGACAVAAGVARRRRREG